ncbi:MAG: hypothetical protein LBS93_01380 [Synergistaceae bacterium]|jgi:hypothetical protein|nr:hypothetical protein [Synergistaceae bacterium]
MKRVMFLCLSVLFALFATLAPARSGEAANKFETAMAKWVRQEEYKNDLGARFIVRATLYTADFIDNLMQNEAEKNLWTASELEDYKYNFLKGLNIEDNVAIHLEFNQLGPTAHMAPFNEKVQLWIGNKKYGPTEYDQRFNFPLQGKRDGIVYFARYDEKTGESLFNKNTTLRLIMLSATSPILGTKEVRINWDVTADTMGALSGSTAADRMEVDRLLRRMERLAAEKAELESQLESKNQEIDDINSRIEELQGK